jgi:MFS family permease
MSEVVSKELPTKVDSRPKSFAFKFSFGCLCACNFVSVLDTVIVASALPAIADALNARSNDAYWWSAGFLLAQAISQPFFGAFSEVFGRKTCLLSSLTCFTASSLFCAVAPNVTCLVVARVVRVHSAFIVEDGLGVKYYS